VQPLQIFKPSTETKFEDLEWVTRYTQSGLPYRLLEDPSESMFPIPQHYFEMAVYIYPTLADAKADEKVGGSGFMVGYTLENNPAYYQLYVVTNRHVIKGLRNPALKLNTYKEGSQCIETNENRWIPHPDGDDLAVLPLEISQDEYRFYSINTQTFATRDMLNNFTILPGDDVFMVGRFVSLEGEKENTPTARFGNVARTIGEKIDNNKNGFAHKQESFLIDCRSLPGYSGSPVFITMYPRMPRPPYYLVPDNHRQYKLMQHGPFLLGIDWLHIENYQHALRRNPKTNEFEKDPDLKVPTNTGLAGVIPAWRLLALLDMEELKMQRTKEDQKITAEKNSLSYRSFDSASEPDEKPFTEGDFEADLRKVARRIDPDAKK
jgi:hypothetical protein